MLNRCYNVTDTYTFKIKYMQLFITSYKLTLFQLYENHIHIIKPTNNNENHRKMDYKLLKQLLVYVFMPIQA